MTFLPIVDRELRVAARKRSTFWSRFLAALAAMVLFAAIMGLSGLSKGAFAPQLGTILFSIFSWLSFFGVAAAGVFLTADTLSEEKREGTLGLLFLTDLRGYDVVLGKILATSLQALYGLLAVFPVISVAFLVGGLAGGAFWKMMLVLCNTLFLSLAAGVFVSAISRDTQKALSGAGAVILAVLLAPMLLDWMLAGWDQKRYEPWLGMVSPFHGFIEVQRSVSSGYWLSMLFTQLSGWAFLAAASGIIKHSWQEKSRTTSSRYERLMQQMRFGSPVRRLAWRRRMLAINPVRWLAGRDFWLGRAMWVLLLAWAGLLLTAYTFGGITVVSGLHQSIFYLLYLAMRLWFAIQAARLFVDLRANGMLELILVSPLKVAELINGQFAALMRTFALPVAILIGMSVLSAVFQTRQMMENFGKMNGGASAIGFADTFILQQIVACACNIVTTLTSLPALGWFTMWMGMTSRRIHIAVIKGIVFVLILPWFGLTFLQVAMMIGGAFMNMGKGGGYPNLWLPIVITSALAVVVHLGFIFGSRRKLLRDLRELALANDAPAASVMPLRRRTPPPLPPVIPA